MSNFSESTTGDFLLLTKKKCLCIKIRSAFLCKLIKEIVYFFAILRNYLTYNNKNSFFDNKLRLYVSY